MPTSDKILAVFPGALGDFICFLPALGRLALMGNVDLLAKSEYSDLVPTAVTVRSLNCREISRLFIGEAGQDEELERFFGSYAGVYSWMGSNEPDLINNLRRLSHGTLQSFPFGPSRRMHRVDYYLSCLGEYHPLEAVPRIALRLDAVVWAAEFWHKNGLEGARVLALSPGSGAEEKNWPAEHFQAIARQWEKSVKGKVLVFTGPVEAERGKMLVCGGSRIVIRNVDLAKVAALLARSHLYLGNDSGISHLAAALDIESFVLFGPTDPVQWSPRGKRVTVVSQRVECSPCARPVMRNCPHRKCLNELRPKEIASLLE